jgi:3,4-dihydroxy 2-butanone 4-phosphate synthase/GTP cyclohydrolase II
MNDDGTMSRMNDLIKFSGEYGIKIGTIRDLISYRIRHDCNVEQVAEINVETGFGGKWQSIAFRNKIDGAEMVALVKGNITDNTDTLVCMHQLSLFDDTLLEPGPRSGNLGRAMRAIAERGSGIVILVNRAIQNRYSKHIQLRAQGEMLDSDLDELTDYAVGAQILGKLGVKDIVLLSNSGHATHSIESYGLNVISNIPL